MESHSRSALVLRAESRPLAGSMWLDVADRGSIRLAVGPQNGPHPRYHGLMSSRRGWREDGVFFEHIRVPDVQLRSTSGGDCPASWTLELPDDRGGLPARAATRPDYRGRGHGSAFQGTYVLAGRTAGICSRSGSVRRVWYCRLRICGSRPSTRLTSEGDCLRMTVRDRHVRRGAGSGSIELPGATLLARECRSGLGGGCLRFVRARAAGRRAGRYRRSRDARWSRRCPLR